MKKPLFLLALTAISHLALSQALTSGLMNYTTLLKFDTGPVRTMASTIAFRGTESLVENEQQYGKPTTKDQSGNVDITLKFSQTSQHYKDLTTKQLISRESAENEMIIIDDVLIPIDWKISSSKKQIGRFTCQKATGKVRGRAYTAWFTNQIAVSTGPWKLYGLPGLILEAEDETGEVRFVFESVQIPAPAGMIVKAPVPKKGQKRMTPAGLRKYTAEKFENIRRMLTSKPGVTQVTVEILPGKSIEMNEK